MFWDGLWVLIRPVPEVSFCVSGWAYVTNSGSDGMMTTAGLELPYPRVSRARFRDETSRRGFWNFNMHIRFTSSSWLMNIVAF